MILNAREMYFKENAAFPSIILLAIEDVTEMVLVAERLAEHMNDFENDHNERTNKLESMINILSEKVTKLKK